MKSNTWIVVVLVVLCLIVGVQSWVLWKYLPLGSKQDSAQSSSYPIGPQITKKQKVAVPNIPVSPIIGSQWDPFEEMEQMQTQMNRLFKNSFSRASRLNSQMPMFSSYDPEVDIQVKDDEYILKVDLPGIEKDKIDVKVQNGYLILSGERKSESENTNNQNFYQMERSFGSFVRSIPLPQDADSQGLKADSKDGVLTVHIPRMTSRQTEPQKIDIQ